MFVVVIKGIWLRLLFKVKGCAVLWWGHLWRAPK
jgi:hypothetical protein